MGKPNPGTVPACFGEDASSLDRGSTFNVIGQGHLGRAKQWSSHSRADSGRGPPLGSGTQTMSLIRLNSVYLHIIVSGSVGTVSGHTVRDQNFHFY